MFLLEFEQLILGIQLLILRLEALVLGLELFNFGLQVRDHSRFVLEVQLDLCVCLVLDLELIGKLLDLALRVVILGLVELDSGVFGLALFNFTLHGCIVILSLVELVQRLL